MKTRRASKSVIILVMKQARQPSYNCITIKYKQNHKQHAIGGLLKAKPHDYSIQNPEQKNAYPISIQFIMGDLVIYLAIDVLCMKTKKKWRKLVAEDSSIRIACVSVETSMTLISSSKV